MSGSATWIKTNPLKVFAVEKKRFYSGIQRGDPAWTVHHNQPLAPFTWNMFTTFNGPIPAAGRAHAATTCGIRFAEGTARNERAWTLKVFAVWAELNGLARRADIQLDNNLLRHEERHWHNCIQHAKLLADDLEKLSQRSWPYSKYPNPQAVIDTVVNARKKLLCEAQDHFDRTDSHDTRRGQPPADCSSITGSWRPF